MATLHLDLLSKARDRTHNLKVPSWIHFCCATMGTPIKPFLKCKHYSKICDMVLFWNSSFTFFCFFFFSPTENGFSATHSNSRRFHEPAKSLYLSLFAQHYLGTSSSASPAQCKSLYCKGLSQPEGCFHRRTLIACISRLWGNSIVCFSFIVYWVVQRC